MGSLSVISAKRVPSDLPQKLREIADKAERGEITAFEASYVEGDHYEMLHAASLESALVLSQLLADTCLRRMYE